MERKWPAHRRSGTCGAKAFQTRSTEYDIDSQYVDVGAGRTAWKTLPSGAMTRMGRKKPALAKACRPMTAMQVSRTPDTVPGRGELMEPFPWGALPVKSTPKAPSEIVNFAL